MRVLASIFVLLVVGPAVSSDFSGLKYLYPLGTVDRLGLVPIGRKVGAGPEHVEALRRLRAGDRTGARTLMARRVERKPEDLLAWRLLFESARGDEPATFRIYSLLQKIKQDDRKRSGPLGQPLAVVGTVGFLLAGKSGLRTDDRWGKMARERGIWPPDNVVNWRPKPPRDIVEALMIVDYLDGQGVLSRYRSELRSWGERFREPAFRLALSRAYSQGRMGSSYESDAPPDQAAAYRVAREVIRDHPEIALGYYYAGQQAFYRDRSRAAGYLRRFLEIGDREPARIERARSLLRQLEKGG